MLPMLHTFNITKSEVKRSRIHDLCMFNRTVNNSVQNINTDSYSLLFEKKYPGHISHISIKLLFNFNLILI